MIDVNEVVDDGSANAVIEPVIDDSPVVDSDESMVQDYLEENEITYYENQDQENFKTNLLTGDANAHMLFNHIESPEFLNSDGSFSDRTIELAKANNMSDEEIHKHQNTIYKQMEDVRHKLIVDSGFSVGYGEVVLGWMISNFSDSEVKTFMADTAKDAVGSLKSLERYYIDITVNGKER